MNAAMVSRTNYKLKIRHTHLLQCMFVTVLIFLGLINSLFIAVAVAVSLLIVFRSDTEQSLLFLLMLLPLANIFKFSPSQFSMFTIITGFVILKLAYKNMSEKNTIIPVMFILMFVIFAISFNGFYGLNRLLNITIGFLLMFLAFITSKKLSLFDVTVYFSIGILISSCIALLNTQIPYINEFISIAKISIGEPNLFTRFCGIQGNPNYYTLDITVALCGLMILYVYGQINTLFYVFAVPLSIFGLMSVSKSFLITIFFALLFYFYISARKSAKQLVKGIAFLVIGIAVAYYLIGADYLNAYIYRFISDFSGAFSISSATTGRSDIFIEYVDHLFNSIESLFLGDGINATYLSGEAPHNYYLELLFHLGILGSAIYTCTMLSVFKTHRAMIKRNFANYFPLIVLLIRAFAINLLFYDNLFFYIIIIWVTYNTNLSIKFTKLSTNPKHRM